MLVSLTVLWDIRVHRIPNIFIVFLILINSFNLFLFTLTGKSDLSATVIVLIKVILIFLILYPFFTIGALGAGDIKLIMVTAVGCEDPFLYTFVVFVIASIMSLIRIRVSDDAKCRFYLLQYYILNSFHIKPFYQYETAPKASDRIKYSIHLSIPVFIALSLYYAYYYLF